LLVLHHILYNSLAISESKRILHQKWLQKTQSLTNETPLGKDVYSFYLFHFPCFINFEIDGKKEIARTSVWAYFSFNYIFIYQSYFPLTLSLSILLIFLTFLVLNCNKCCLFILLCCQHPGDLQQICVREDLEIISRYKKSGKRRPNTLFYWLK
jgi:hypothetical protein